MPSPPRSFFARLVLSVFVLINQVKKERCRRTKCGRGEVFSRAGYERHRAAELFEEPLEEWRGLPLLSCTVPGI